jgi:hypothetical protein
VLVFTHPSIMAKSLQIRHWRYYGAMVNDMALFQADVQTDELATPVAKPLILPNRICRRSPLLSLALLGRINLSRATAVRTKPTHSARCLT